MTIDSYPIPTQPLAHDGLWLHLDHDGDAAAIAFVGEPFPYEGCFVGGRTVVATAAMRARTKRTSWAASDPSRTSIRVAWTVAVFARGDDAVPVAWQAPRLRGAAPRRAPVAFELRIFEHGSIVYRTIARLRVTWPLDTWLFELRRHGAPHARHTTYTLTPLRRLRSAERRALAASQSFDLGLYYGVVALTPETHVHDTLPPTKRSADLTEHVGPIEVRVPRKRGRAR